METSDWLVAVLLWKDEWRSVIVKLGARSVMTLGVQWTLASPVYN
jgi:hypothetical protein